MARILISAGEASGDIHAAAVTRELKNIAPDTEVFGMGGDCLREAGGEVLFDIKEHNQKYNIKEITQFLKKF